MKDLELHRFFFFTMRPPLRGSQQGEADSSRRERGALKGFPVPSEYKQTLENALQRGQYPDREALAEGRDADVKDRKTLVEQVAQQKVLPTHFPRRLFSSEGHPAAKWKPISETPTQEAAESSSQQHPPEATTATEDPDRKASAENLHQKAEDSNQNASRIAQVLVDAVATTDALYVLFSVAYHEVEYNLNQPKKLENDIAELLEISKDIQVRGDQFLGEARCWCIQVDGEPTKDDVSELWRVLHSQSSNQSDSNQTPSENEPCKILQSTGEVMLAFDPEPETYLIAYSSQNCNQLNEILHHALPLIALQRLKIRDISEIYPRVYEKATAIEQDLEAKMEAARKPRRLEDIERLSLEASALQQEFIEQVSILENYKKTLEISVRNIKLVCDTFGLTPENTSESEGSNTAKVWEALTRQSEVSFDIDQIETHLYYLSSTRAQAELALESLNTAATVRNAQWTRKINIIGAPFAAASIAEVFQDELGLWWAKLGLIAALTFLLWLLTGVVREFSNQFKRMRK